MKSGEIRDLLPDPPGLQDVVAAPDSDIDVRIWGQCKF